MVYGLALRLRKTAGEVMAMPAQEFGRWCAYFALEKADRDRQGAGDLGSLFELEE